MFKDYEVGKVYTAGISTINGLALVMLILKNDEKGLTCVRVTDDMKDNAHIFLPIEHQEKPQYQFKPAPKSFAKQIELAEKYLHRTSKKEKVHKDRSEHMATKKVEKKKAAPKQAKEKKVTTSGQIREMLEKKLCTKEEIMKALKLESKKATDLIWIIKMRNIETKTWIDKDGKFGIKK